MAGILLLVAVFLAGAAVYYRNYYNPYPDSGLMLDVRGIDASAIESVGLFNNHTGKYKEAVAEEEIQTLLGVINHAVTFQEKLRGTYIGSPEWSVDFFMKDGAVIRLGLSSMEDSAIKWGPYCYRFDDGIDFEALRKTPDTVASRYGPESRRYLKKD